MVLQVIIPMAGMGSRFVSYGFKINKYLLPLDLDYHLMIERAITSLNITIPCFYYFIINEMNGPDELIRKTLNQICGKYGFNYHISSVDYLTEGPASTVATIRSIINMDDPLLVSNSDQVLVWNFENFLKTCGKYDGCVLTYRPPYPLTLGASDKHSFIHLNELSGQVDECREKIVLSHQAIVGTHYYKKARFFYDAYDYMVKTNLRAPNGEFYMSLSNQAMIENRLSIGYHDMDESCEHFYPTGEPQDYFNYLYSCGGYQHNVKPLNDAIVNFPDGGEIKYVKSTNVFHNLGLVIILSDTCMAKSLGQELLKYEITNDDIIGHDIELISIISPELPQLAKQIWNSSQFIRGWFVGNFMPSIHKITQFEVGALTHVKNDRWDYHYHKKADEINILLEGSMLLNNHQINQHDVFIIPRGQVACPIFVETCRVMCIKIPSVIGDKYCV